MITASNLPPAVPSSVRGDIKSTNPSSLQYKINNHQYRVTSSSTESKSTWWHSIKTRLIEFFRSLSDSSPSIQHHPLHKKSFKCSTQAVDVDSKKLEVIYKGRYTKVETEQITQQWQQYKRSEIESTLLLFRPEDGCLADSRILPARMETVMDMGYYPHYDEASDTVSVGEKLTFEKMQSKYKGQEMWILVKDKLE
ncbi:hypothetical protein D5R81_06895 [Parashewanella spongiae]|uniref:Uncharacterized protein n=1 Tax=Parashewanella spongiae TaxID=342950 RepID=A0A3A6TQ48_9GAMM|nr:hypothetical protein [Parashewanella spongiae]MCL1077705.1 hypothetical protein [Parashewanella spongiae]RJY18099.1 hypothetical protein D5R81_06895 [Parashewanella spongiae]